MEAKIIQHGGYKCDRNWRHTPSSPEEYGEYQLFATWIVIICYKPWRRVDTNKWTHMIFSLHGWWWDEYDTKGCVLLYPPVWSVDQPPGARVLRCVEIQGSSRTRRECNARSLEVMKSLLVETNGYNEEQPRSSELTADEPVLLRWLFELRTMNAYCLAWSS